MIVISVLLSTCGWLFLLQLLFIYNPILLFLLPCPSFGILFLLERGLRNLHLWVHLLYLGQV
jgi:hypothetical protein